MGTNESVAKGLKSKRGNPSCGIAATEETHTQTKPNQTKMKTSKEITVQAIDLEGYNVHSHDGFETIKEAKAWVKEVLLNRGYWNRLAENETFADEIATIQLTVNGEIHSDWFPEFAAA
jgi:hypothetical protein